MAESKPAEYGRALPAICNYSMKSKMGQLHRIIATFCVGFLLASCAGPAALESQSSQRDIRLSRIYFLREKGVIGALGGTAAAAEIMVDGKVVGSVTSGSYFFVDRQPGIHKLSVKTALAFMAYETDVQVPAESIFSTLEFQGRELQAPIS